MKQAIKQLEKIKEKKEAIANTKSKCLIRDYEKALKRDVEELRVYCRYKNIDYNTLVRLYFNKSFSEN